MRKAELKRVSRADRAWVLLKDVVEDRFCFSLDVVFVVHINRQAGFCRCIESHR